MNTIQYQILRYLPDRVSGEFVNLGIVAFDPSNKVVEAQFINKIGKISGFFQHMNSRYLVKSVRSIQEEVTIFSNRLQNELSFSKIKSIEEITKSILPKDDSSLIFSEIKKTLDIGAAAVVNDFFSKFVHVHLLEDEDEEIRKDKEVWNKVYKKHFDDNGISSHLANHKIKTKNDELEFDKAWKNGVWNCFETVSFNLTRVDAIKNKVYKWVGKLDELNSSSETIHIYLLSVLPHDHPELKDFIVQKINEKATQKTKIDLVSESEIDKVTLKIRGEIEAHH